MRLVQNMLREHEIRDTIEGGGGSECSKCHRWSKRAPSSGVVSRGSPSPSSRVGSIPLNFCGTLHYVDENAPVSATPDGESPALTSIHDSDYGTATPDEGALALSIEKPPPS